MKRNLFLAIISMIAFSAFFSPEVAAQQHTYGFHGDEKPFDGNDLISYFDGKVLPGKDNITYTYKEVTLYFANDENRERFKKDPEKYFPAYNGWCAIALASGTLARPNYSSYKVQDGKLLFFEVRAFFNGKTAWEKDPDINRIAADAKYSEIFKKDQ
ncbi:MAG: YHS domain-containing (seleno)protein [Bacteroidota bacterium]